MMNTETYDAAWMSRYLKGLTVSIGLITASSLAVAETVHPAKLSSSDLTGKAFEDPNTIMTETPTGNILDITSLKSSDGKFASGMYKAGKSRLRLPNPMASTSSCFPGRQRHPDLCRWQPDDH